MELIKGKMVVLPLKAMSLKTGLDRCVLNCVDISGTSKNLVKSWIIEIEGLVSLS